MEKEFFNVSVVPSPCGKSCDGNSNDDVIVGKGEGMVPEMTFVGKKIMCGWIAVKKCAFGFWTHRRTRQRELHIDKTELWSSPKKVFKRNA